MEKQHHYEAVLTWSGGADGGTRDYKSYSRTHAVEIAGKPGFSMSADPAFKGDPAVLNPEECLLVSLASCHMLSYLAYAALEGVEVTAYADRAAGTMTQKGFGGRFTEVVLRPEVTITTASDAAKAEALHAKASEACFIAASVNFPVRHEPVIRSA